MMTGQQGIRDGESSWFVENQLEYLGQLRPPSVQMNGMLESVPVSTDLIKEHNYQMGHVVSRGDSAATLKVQQACLTPCRAC